MDLSEVKIHSLRHPPFGIFDCMAIGYVVGQKTYSLFLIDGQLYGHICGELRNTSCRATRSAAAKLLGVQVKEVEKLYRSYSESRRKAERDREYGYLKRRAARFGYSLQPLKESK